MKNITLLAALIMLLITTTSYAQVGIGTTQPEATAALDIASTDKGVLVPRMLESERVLIGDSGTGPATGLLVYQTDGNAGFYFYDGNDWAFLGKANDKWTFNDNSMFATQPNNIGIRTENPTSALQIGDLSNSTEEFLTMAGAGGNSSKTGIRMRHFSDSFGFTIESSDLVPAQGLNVLRHAGNEEGESALFVGVASGRVGIGTTIPKTTLQVQGNPENTTMADGVQVPVLSLGQLEAKVTAYGTDQDGAIVYVNDVSTASTTTETIAITATGYYYYDASNDAWKAMGGASSSSTTTYSVGDFAQGGIVFWVDETGQHGLVAAKEDQSTGVRWYAGTYGNTQAKGDGPYAGEANTSIIIAAQVAIGDDNNTYAARICNELQITEGGKTYGDWYLPSKEELNLMYQNKATIDAAAGANGGSGFASAYYWSSTEFNNFIAWEQFFANGDQINLSKNFPSRVRAVRAF